MKKEDEIILVVSRKKLFNDEALTFQGVTSDKSLVADIMLNIDKYYKSMRRGSVNEVDVPVSRNAELNFDYKQPIPYIVIRRGDEYFVTQRLEGGGESRLHGKLSMGAGGHMNPLEKDFYAFKIVLAENTARELEEELDITGEIKIDTIGLINDDSEEVSRVHIGILGVIDLEDADEVAVRETEQLAGSWYTLDQLRDKEVYDRLENWGKIVVDMM
ncbi:hypothetical protein VVS20_22205 [Viridibacillus arvi]|uniref:hypothetical protein n=1 Tax=Viridibacillus arvi TaxID=263475 RepID=UPI0034CDFD1C